MRPIDADKVLETMRSNMDMQELYLPTHFIDLVIENMPTIEAEPDKDWISVKDKLPRLGQRVMAFCRAGILTFLRYDGEEWFEMSSRNEYLHSFVTHWQPLPKPPKGE